MTGLHFFFLILSSSLTCSSIYFFDLFFRKFFKIFSKIFSKSFFLGRVISPTCLLALVRLPCRHVVEGTDPVLGTVVGVGLLSARIVVTVMVMPAIAVIATAHRRGVRPRLRKMRRLLLSCIYSSSNKSSYRIKPPLLLLSIVISASGKHRDLVVLSYFLSFICPFEATLIRSIAATWDFPSTYLEERLGKKENKFLTRNKFPLSDVPPASAFRPCLHHGWGPWP